MAKKIHSFIVLILALSAPLSTMAQKRNKDFVDSNDAWEKSIYNRGYIEGMIVGRQLGLSECSTTVEDSVRTSAYQNGFKQCQRIWADSMAEVVQRTIGTINPNNFPEINLMLKSFYDGMNARDEIRQSGFDDGWKKGYEDGYEAGYNLKFDSVYAVCLKHGKEIHYLKHFNNYPFFLDYDKIARLLGSANGSKGYIEKPLFGDALRTLNLAVLEYLVLVTELSPTEKADAFKTYYKIHESLVDMAYQNYLDLYQRLSRNPDKNFYNFKYSVSIRVFVDIWLFYICALSDICFTYAKKNSQYAAWAGFEVGSISELLITKVVLPIEDYFLKAALRIDYEQHIPELIPVSVSILSPLIADIRTHSKIVKETVKLAPDHVVNITMEIRTIVQLGYNVSDLEIVNKHLEQKILIYMSDNPRLLQVIAQDYKVLQVDNLITFKERCSFTTEISEPILKEIFDKHKDKPETLSVCNTALSYAAIRQIEPVLAKILEPAIAIPYSCYDVNLSFGGKTTTLIKTKCP